MERNRKEEKHRRAIPSNITDNPAAPRQRGLASTCFIHVFPNSYQQSLATAREQRKKHKAALAATRQRELQLRPRLRSGGQRRRRRIDGVDPRGSAGTTLIWPRRNNGTNCSDSAAQWPLLVRQARHVTGEAGAAQWFEHPAPGEPHRTPLRFGEPPQSPPKKNTGEPEESLSKRDAVDHCDVFQRTWEVLNN